MTIAELMQELDQEAKATRRVLERVPPDRYDWRPHEKSFTLGQLAMHVAMLPGAISEMAGKPTFDVKTRIPRPSPGGADELMSTYDQSVEKARTLLGAMKDSDLALPWRMVDGEREVMALPRSGVLRTILFNHWYHHRGQLTVYLRLLNVPLPSVYGPSADEAGM